MAARLSRLRRSKFPVRQCLILEGLEARRMLAVLTVDTDQDVVDAADGLLSLREAIGAANAQVGADQIVFDLGHDDPASLRLEHGELEITDALTITGPGRALLTIDAQQKSRIFNITAGSGDFAIEGMVVTRGRSVGEGDPFSFSGGAVRSNSTGTLLLHEVSITDSTAEGPSAQGGAASSRGPITISASNVSGNSADCFGGGVATSGPVTITSSTISGNSARGGGGIYTSSSAPVTVTSSSISGNSGRGIHFGVGGSVTITSSSISTNSGEGVYGGGPVTVDSSDISGNSGTGIWVSGRVTITSSTISSNSGTGIFVSGPVTITSSTISSNSDTGISASGPVTIGSSTITGNWDGGIRASGSEILVTGSIIAANWGGESPDLDLQDFSGTLTVRYSLIGDTGASGLEEGPLGAPDANGNLIGGPAGGVIDPRLAPLADNGGPTWTHALLPDSPAIDAGDPAAVAGVDGVPRFDQRGDPYVRVVNGCIDIGAVDRQSLTASIADVPSPRLTPTDAVTIHFTQPVSGFDLSDLKLSRNGRGENVLTGNERLESPDGQSYVLSGLIPGASWAGYYTLTLNAPGSLILAADGTPLDSGTSVSWVVGRATLGLTVDTLVDEWDGRIDDGDISLRDALAAAAPEETIDFAPALDGGTLLLTLGELAITRSVVVDATALENGVVLDASASDPTPDEEDGLGSRIFRIDDGNPYVDSPLTLLGLRLTGGDVEGEGSAVLASEGITLESSLISGNSAASGGAVIRASGDVTISSSMISGNSGRGISASGNVTVSSSTISGNLRVGDFFSRGGGGIFASGDVTVSSSTISGNSVGKYGAGGIHATGSVTVRHSTISGNSTSCGTYSNAVGGIRASAVTIISSSISGNSGCGGWGSPIGTIQADDVSVTSSTVSDNRGGGIYGDSVAIRSSTISGNEGAGVWASRAVAVASSTIVGNGGGGRGGRRGGIRASGSEVSVTGSIVAANQGGASPDLELHDFSGTLTVQYSLIGDAGDSGLAEAPLGAPDANGNLIGGPAGGVIGPRLGPLMDNGGPTWTHALLPDSPAIDMGDPAAVAGGDGLPLFDQRGEPYARVVNGRIDMGAVERQSLTATIESVPSPAMAPVDAVTIQFNQPVIGFDLSDLSLSRNGLGGNLLTGDERLESNDGQTYVLSGLTGSVSWAGYYTFTISLTVSGSEILARDGSPLDTGATTSWVMHREPLGLTVDTLLDERDGWTDDGDISLRDALDAAAPGEMIDFAPSLDGGKLRLSLGELAINRSVIVDATSLETGLVLDASASDPTPDEEDGLGSRVFRIDDGDPVADSPVTLRGLTLTGGDVDGEGGALLTQETLVLESISISGNRALSNGGAIWAGGSLLVNNSTISQNASLDEGVGGIWTQGPVTVTSSRILENFGGGIQAGGDLIVDASTISENTNWAITVSGDARVTSSTISGNGGGGISASGDVIVDSSIISQNKGSGVSASGDATVTSSDISGNVAQGWGGGGGIFASGNVTVSSSIVSRNSIDSNASGYGGGIFALGDVTVASSDISRNTGSGVGAHGAVTVSSSTISGNSGRGISDGGIMTVTSSTISGNLEGGIYASYPLTVVSSTISGNSATHGDGGGIFARRSVTIVSSTITANTARDSGGGIRIIFSSPVSIANSIVAGNHAPRSPDASFAGAPVAPEVHHSLIGYWRGTGLQEAPLGAPDANGNLIGGRVGGVIDPRLGPLANNGGPTWTHKLLPDSPAIDMGDPAAVAGVDGVPLFDQRGEPYARVVNGRIDMGALEHNPAAEIDRFCQALEESDPAFDLNGDGVVDLGDLGLLVQQLGTILGDANLDGTFNSSDLVAVFQAGQYEDGIPRNSTWSTGDWNCDREFDTSDFVFVLQAGGYEAAASPAARLAAIRVDSEMLEAGARPDRLKPTLSSRSGPAGPAAVRTLRPSAKMMARSSVATLRWARDQLFVAAQRESFFADLDERVERAVASLLGSLSLEDGPVG